MGPHSRAGGALPFPALESEEGAGMVAPGWRAGGMSMLPAPVIYGHVPQFPEERGLSPPHHRHTRSATVDKMTSIPKSL